MASGAVSGGGGTGDRTGVGDVVEQAHVDAALHGREQRGEDERAGVRSRSGRRRARGRVTCVRATGTRRFRVRRPQGAALRRSAFGARRDRTRVSRLSDRPSRANDRRGGRAVFRRTTCDVELPCASMHGTSSRGGGHAHRQGPRRRLGDTARARDPGRGRELRLRHPQAGARALRGRARVDRRDALPAAPSPRAARVRDDGVANATGRASPQVLRDHRRGTSGTRGPAAAVGRPSRVR